ncbi:MAG: KilA-N domain-containing protein [Paludibacteraceae bacterium]|nr:KilA-N domain-containing protein [Paludibacteraceae bacterium]
MAKIQPLIVKDTTIRTLSQNGMDYICITDIARQKNGLEPNIVVGNWMRNRNTIEYLGLWEMLNNPTFNPIEFEGVKSQAGLNAFTLSPSRWIELTHAIGIISSTGRNGGTYAQRDIAFKFASWVSVEFELYLIKEFQRLKEEEQKALGWSAKRELAKINYHIHTDAIKEHLVPQEIDPYHRSLIYANEADVLNVALFGMTAKEWRDAHPKDKGNIRDYATINQLICLSNMENLNAVFINEGLSQSERLQKLNQIAIQQMTVLENVESKKILKA